MKSFLEQVSDEITERHGDALEGVCIVFPTHRAAGVFRHALAARLTRPVFAPAILAVRDFIQTLSGLETTAELPLLFELYHVWHRHAPDEPFDKFLGWGEMMLRDFSDIDLESVHAGHLFTNITDLKRIEAEFGLGEEEARRIADFWKHFSDRAPTKLQAGFLANWEALLPVYTEFRKTLQGKHLAYEGMAWQQALANVRREGTAGRWTHVWFAGFYGLSRAHRQIVAALREHVPTEVRYDADVLYTDDTQQEAGYYFHRNKKPPATLQWKGDYFSGAKDVRVVGVPLQAGQAKYAGQAIAGLLEAKKLDPARTVVVVPDEQLLVPVLYALPAAAGTPSVSMGYPLRLSAVASLVESLHLLHTHMHAAQGKPAAFLSRDLLRLLRHPFAGAVEPRAKDACTAILQAGAIRTQADDAALAGMGPVLRALLRPQSAPAGILATLASFLEAVIDPGTGGVAPVERRLAAWFTDEVLKLEKAVDGFAATATAATAWLLLQRITASLRVPLPGSREPGLQVMGILETRALDFDTVFILSMNEGVLPPAGIPASYIPYALRKGFGMPGREERDAVYAYHYYRLLQRASDIYLLYDTEVKSFSGGEKSRYLYQLAFELQQNHPGLNVRYEVASAPLKSPSQDAIAVYKTEAVLAGMRERYLGDAATARGLSPSALGTYIHCPLQFYFRHVARIEEPAALSDTVEADAFGRILHGAMERLYVPGTTLTEAAWPRLKKEAARAVDEAFRREYPHVRGAGEGLFYISKKVIRTLVDRILDADRTLLPFEVEALEAKLKTALPRGDEPPVVLQGTIDRVHVAGGVHCIVDYKTGGDEVKARPDIEKLITDPKAKAMFQLMCYSLVYRGHFPDRRVRAGIYKARALSGGIKYLNDGEDVTGEQLDVFSDRLRQLVDEILDPGMPFSQTEDEKRCTYCPYREICAR